MKAYGLLGLCLVFSLSVFAQVEEMVVPNKFPVRQKTEESSPAQKTTESWEEKMIETPLPCMFPPPPSKKFQKPKKNIDESLSGCQIQNDGAEIQCADGRLFILSGRTTQSQIQRELERPLDHQMIKSRSGSGQ